MPKVKARREGNNRLGKGNERANVTLPGHTSLTFMLKLSNLLALLCMLVLSTTMTKSYTRPGVDAAARLAKITSPKIWEEISKQYKPMLLKKKGQELVDMDDWCERLAEKLQTAESPSISKTDLVSIIEWKFAKGKPRPYMKHIQSNTDKQVKDYSMLAFVKSQQGNVDGAFDELTNLNGLGIAGASAILSLHRPDLCAFMDDEVIEALYDGKRGYTKKIYNDMNVKCCEIAETVLGGGDWTPREVGKTLWTAARMSASGEEDLTIGDQEESTVKRETKRRRKS